jgi:predicted nucleic acid-binding protein
MRFWDSSAIIPLCLKEQMSETMKRLIKADEDIVVWWATKIECLSALARRRRKGILDPDSEMKARAILSALSAEWSEVQPSELVRQRTERLLVLHSLKSADSFQLAAALLWAQESPQGFQMVCLDQSLREAAQKEGFTVIP